MYAHCHICRTDFGTNSVIQHMPVGRKLAYDVDRGRLWVVQYLQYPFPAGLNITSYDQYLRARYSGVPAAPPNGSDILLC